jgi:hypothetical protein
MVGIYGVVVLAGGYFGIATLTTAGPLSIRTLVQAAIMVLVGGLGLLVTLRKGPRSHLDEL